MQRRAVDGIITPLTADAIIGKPAKPPPSVDGKWGGAKLLELDEQLLVGLGLDDPSMDFMWNSGNDDDGEYNCTTTFCIDLRDLFTRFLGYNSAEAEEEELLAPPTALTK